MGDRDVMAEPGATGEHGAMGEHTATGEHSAMGERGAIRALTRRLLPLLLVGDHPALPGLRAQASAVVIERVDESGSGFFVHLDMPSEVAAVDVAYAAGGDAVIVFEGDVLPAGCVLFVRDGRLSMLELYTYDGVWPGEAAVIDVRHPRPLFDDTGAS